MHRDRFIAAATMLTFASALSPATALAAGWEKGLDASLGANQSHTRIHAAGEIYEKRTTGLELRLDGSLDKDTGSSRWKNSLKLDYAGSKTKDETNAWNDPKWIESADQLTADSVHRWKGSFFADPYAGANLQTTVFDTNSEGEWAAFRPLQLRESLGLSLPIMDSPGNDFTFRAGVFYQHYLNRGQADRDPHPGMEFVLEYDGDLAKNIAFKSKAGMYTGLASVDDYGNAETKSRKAVLEWDNKLVITLTRALCLNLTYNVDNKDVSATEIGYEIDHRTTLALNWKVF